MTKVNNTYHVQPTTEKVVNIFQQPKPKTCSWNEQYVYREEASHVAGALHMLVLYSIVKNTAPNSSGPRHMTTTEWLLARAAWAVI